MCDLAAIWSEHNLQHIESLLTLDLPTKNRISSVLTVDVDWRQIWWSASNKNQFPIPKTPYRQFGRTQTYYQGRIQKRALRIIVYPNILPYSELLETLKLESLSNRRHQLATKFAKSVLTSPDHRHLLPQSRELITGRNLRNSTHMTLPRIRTQRRMLSPIPYFIQLLNSTS